MKDIALLPPFSTHSLLAPPPPLVISYPIPSKAKQRPGYSLFLHISYYVPCV